MFEFQRARETMSKILKRDDDLYYGYQSNIAMLLHDRYGITDYTSRNNAARDIIELVFHSK